MKPLLLFLAALLWSLASPALASSAVAGGGNEEARLAGELGKLNQSLENLQQLMKEQLAANKLNSAIAYLNWRSRKIEILERDLENMKKERDRLQGFLDELSQRSARLDEEKRNNPNLSTQDFNLAKEELDQRKGLIKKRMEQLESESLGLDIKVGELRSQIDSVERFVQDNLGL